MFALNTIIAKENPPVDWLPETPAKPFPSAAPAAKKRIIDLIAQAKETITPEQRATLYTTAETLTYGTDIKGVLNQAFGYTFGQGSGPKG